jgi:hypothetical protein
VVLCFLLQKKLECSDLGRESVGLAAERSTLKKFCYSLVGLEVRGLANKFHPNK